MTSTKTEATAISPNPNIRGILAMCFAMAAFTVNDAAVKLASESLSVGQVVFLRGLAASALALGIVAAQGALSDLRHLAHPLIATRCVLEGLTAITFIGALSLLPMATVTAVFLSSPLIITVAGALMLGEVVRWRRWMAVVVGFVGMLLVMKPTTEGLNAGVLLALASTFLAVTRDLLTRRIPTSIPTRAVALGTVMVTALVGGVLALFQPWRPVDAAASGYLVIAAIAVTAGNYAIIVAFRVGEVSVISPFRYTLMFWAVIAGLLIFGHWLDATAWMGVALIVAAGIYTLVREARIGMGRPAAKRP